ncbi:MAG: hypothetical protein ACI85U_002405 [Candidatus Promineifilaceae bacterium]|jgi:hypothetical protein
MPAMVDVAAKTSIVIEKINDVSALLHPKSSMRATKKTENERRIPNAANNINVLTPTITQP